MILQVDKAQDPQDRWYLRTMCMVVPKEVSAVFTMVEDPKIWMADGHPQH